MLRRALLQATTASKTAPAVSQTAAAKKRFASSATKKSERILITGSLGQIGSELVTELKQRGHFVIATDVRPLPPALQAKFGPDTPFHYLDVSSGEDLRRLVVEHRATMILHLSAKLSATAEKDPGNSFGVNVRAVENVFEIARHYGLRVYAPSSIAAFGPTTPNLHEIVDDITIQRPLNVYGVSKVYLEMLGEWYNYRFGVDFRSLRYPGILSADTLPGGGTTDYAVEIFYSALEAPKDGNPNERPFVCGVGPNRRLPMMYMPDCLRATCDFIEADNSLLKQRTYNVNAVSFTPEEISKALNETIAKLGPSKTTAKPLKMVYKPDIRDSIAATWPAVLNDQAARKDWGWSHQYGLDVLTKDMLERIEKKLRGGN